MRTPRASLIITVSAFWVLLGGLFVPSLVQALPSLSSTDDSSNKSSQPPRQLIQSAKLSTSHEDYELFAMSHEVREVLERAKSCDMECQKELLGSLYLNPSAKPEDVYQALTLLKEISAVSGDMTGDMGRYYETMKTVWQNAPSLRSTINPLILKSGADAIDLYNRQKISGQILANAVDMVAQTWTSINDKPRLQLIEASIAIIPLANHQDAYKSITTSPAVVSIEDPSDLVVFFEELVERAPLIAEFCDSFNWWHALQTFKERVGRGLPVDRDALLVVVTKTLETGDEKKIQDALQILAGWSSDAKLSRIISDRSVRKALEDADHRWPQLHGENAAVSNKLHSIANQNHRYVKNISRDSRECYNVLRKLALDKAGQLNPSDIRYLF